MKTPKKKEVVKYFKDAKEVACLYDKEPHDISDQNMNISRFEKEWWLDTSEDRRVNIQLWTPDKGYAKILSYKEPKEKTYKITREQVKQLKHNAFHENNQLVVADLKNWFPEVFETKLTVGKWYKFVDNKYNDFLGRVTKLEKDRFWYYGFNTGGTYRESDYYGINEVLREATHQEVTEALTKEVKKRYKAGDYVEKIHRFSNKYITGNNPGIVVDSDYKVWYGGCVVFKDGKFAEIIPTLTIQEAEEKLKVIGVNAKIV